MMSSTPTTTKLWQKTIAVIVSVAMVLTMSTSRSYAYAATPDQPAQTPSEQPQEGAAGVQNGSEKTIQYNIDLDSEYASAFLHDNGTDKNIDADEKALSVPSDVTADYTVEVEKTATIKVDQKNGNWKTSDDEVTSIKTSDKDRTCTVTGKKAGTATITWAYGKTVKTWTVEVTPKINPIEAPVADTNTSLRLAAPAVTPDKPGDKFDVSMAFSSNQEKKTGFNADDEVYFDIYVRNDSNGIIENINVKENLNGATILADDSGIYTVNDDGTATIPRVLAGDMVVVKAVYKVTANDIQAKQQIQNTADATYSGFTKTSNSVSIVPSTLKTRNIYVYMKVGNWSAEAKKALGVEDVKVYNQYDYAPVGVLTVDEAFFTGQGYPSDWETKQYAMLRNTDDWTRFESSIIGFSPTGMVDTGGKKYSQNSGNGVTVEKLMLARHDTGKKSGTGDTALFTQDGSTLTTEYGFSSSASAPNAKQLHLDCVFDFVKVNYVDETGQPVYVKDGQVVPKGTQGATQLASQTLVKGSKIDNPGLTAPDGQVVEYYHEGGNVKWNFATDKANTNTTIVVKTAEKFGAMTVTKEIQNSGSGEGGAFYSGEIAKFTITVQNSGNYALTDIEVEDQLNGATVTPSPTGDYTINEKGHALISKLEGGTKAQEYKDGEKVKIYAQYTITDEDVINGAKNTAVATAGDETTGDGEIAIPVDKKQIEVSQPENVVYNGNEQKQSVTVTDPKTGKTLEEGKDYTIEYKGDTTNVGTVTVTVTGTGAYEGAVDATYQITPKAVTITVNDASKAYGESDPAFTGEVEGLVKSGDLGTVTYKRTNADEAVGTYEGVITAEYTANDNYSVTVNNGDFEIAKADRPADKQIVVTGYSGTYDGEGHGVTVSGNDLPGDHTWYSTDGGQTWTEDAPSVTDASTTDVIVKVTNDNYNDGTDEGTIDIAKKTVTVTADDKSKVYGEDDPALTATVDGTIGSDEVQYTLTRESGEDAGDYAITPSGTAAQGNYSVTFVPGTLTIEQKHIDDPDNPGKPDTEHGITVEQPEDTTYNGNPQEQKPVVKDGDKVLEEGKDYTITYPEDTTNAGTVKIEIIGDGNYTGKVDSSYEINPAKLTVTTDSASKTYDGSALTAPGKIEGLVNGETAAIVTTGSQTDVGTSQNTYRIDWNGTAKQSNYTVVSETLGTLTVTAAPAPVPPAPVPPAADVPTTPTGTISPAPVVQPEVKAVVQAPNPVAGQNIRDDEVPMSSFDDHTACWVHYYIILGMIMTALYTSIVVWRRTRQIKKMKAMDSFEETAASDVPSTETVSANA